MDIAFTPQSRLLTFRNYYSTAPEIGQACNWFDAGEAAKPAAKGDYRIVQRPTPGLVEHSALFRDFAGIKPAPETVRKFLEQHGDLQACVHALYHNDLGNPVVVFPSEPQGSDENDALGQLLSLRNAIRLWDLVKANDQKALAKHLRIEPDAAGNPLIIYDSHPEPAPDMQPPAPETRQHVVLASWHGWPELFGAIQAGDYRPAALAFLRQVIQKQLKGRVNADVLDDPRKPEEMTLRFVPQNLLGALWLQFAHEITGKKNYGQCLVCCKWFRSDGHKDRFYCSKKCTVQAFRDRNKAKLLSNQGVPLEEIAEQLGYDVDVVKNWIPKRKGTQHAKKTKRTRRRVD